MMPTRDDNESSIARPGFQGGIAFATNEDMDAELAFDMQAGHEHYHPDTHTRETDGMFDAENFWLGGGGSGITQVEDDWTHEEQEMHRLIDAGLYGGDDIEEEADGMDIDPVLK